jgi:beta-xylosidase
LIHWVPAGQALQRPDHRLGANFWAPEVGYHDGQFFLYYSVGHRDKNHQLRVAISRSPLGPYSDCQSVLDPQICAFAIDPHPFKDCDGQWYLFYARDFLDSAEGHRAGTALAVTKLTGMVTAAGLGRVVLRAKSDWQRFQKGRLMYGREFDWHTLEGPFVRFHDGLYYCFYSGGRWEDDTYGVDYGVSKNVMGPYSDAGNENGARILRTIPGSLIGPGHNSLIQSPDGRTNIVFHAWDPARRARRMFIEKISWTRIGPRLSRNDNSLERRRTSRQLGV